MRLTGGCLARLVNTDQVQAHHRSPALPDDVAASAAHAATLRRLIPKNGRWGLSQHPAGSEQMPRFIVITAPAAPRATAAPGADSPARLPPSSAWVLATASCTGEGALGRKLLAAITGPRAASVAADTPLLALFWHNRDTRATAPPPTPRGRLLAGTRARKCQCPPAANPAAPRAPPHLGRVLHIPVVF